MKTTVSFPGLGIGEFTMDRVAISFSEKWNIYWYAIIITMGIIVAFIHAYLRTKQEGIKEDDLLDVGLFIIPIGVLGARLYYVLFDAIKHPGSYQNFVDVIAIWRGGLAILGGVLFGAATLVVVCALKKINPLKVMDCVAPGVMMAQAIGRWGNFVNGEAHGGVVPESSPLYFLRMGLFEEGRMQYFHPTFLYESLWNVVGFILITLFYRKKKFNGQIVLAYFIWYGFGRMFIEGLRTDSLYIGSFRTSQVLSAVLFVVGIALMIAGLVFSRRGKFEKWLKVQWATPAAAGVTEAVADDQAASSEAASLEATSSETTFSEAASPEAASEADTADETGEENTHTPKE